METLGMYKLWGIGFWDYSFICRVGGLGSGDLDSGFRNSVFHFRVWGVSGLGCRAWARTRLVGFRDSDLGVRD